MAIVPNFFFKNGWCSGRGRKIWAVHLVMFARSKMFRCDLPKNKKIQCFNVIKMWSSGVGPTLGRCKAPALLTFPLLSWHQAELAFQCVLQPLLLQLTILAACFNYLFIFNNKVFRCYFNRQTKVNHGQNNSLRELRQQGELYGDGVDL